MSQEVWKKLWGVEYRRDLREMQLRTLFNDLEKSGLLGDLILDIGSGLYPVTAILDSSKHTIVTVDLAGLPGVFDNRLHIKGNVETLTNTQLFSTKKTLVQIARFAEINLRQNPQIEQVDTMVFSQILNYVDFSHVLSGATDYLKPGGLFIIVNKPSFGFADLFSEKGVTKNSELKAFFLNRNFTVLKELYPWDEGDDDLSDESMLILAVQKHKPITNSDLLIKKSISPLNKLKQLFKR